MPAASPVKKTSRCYWRRCGGWVTATICCCWAAEAVDPAVGELARPHDAAALAQAVADLYQREPKALGRTARARVEQRYSWDRVFQHQLALYESLLPDRAVDAPRTVRAYG